jgi:hypothetical protein
MNRVYHLDGEVVTLKGLAATHGWPLRHVSAIMRSDDPPVTLDALRARIVRARSTPVYRPTPTESAQRAMTMVLMRRPLTKLAQMDW